MVETLYNLYLTVCQRKLTRMLSNPVSTPERIVNYYQLQDCVISVKAQVRTSFCFCITHKAFDLIGYSRGS